MSQRPCNYESFQESDLIGKADVDEFHKTDDGSWILFRLNTSEGNPKWTIATRFSFAPKEGVTDPKKIEHYSIKLKTLSGLTPEIFNPNNVIIEKI